MDVDLIAVAARSIERIIGVLLGGLAIYFGFRLFLDVPIEKLTDGTIKLPGIEVVLAKAGPGLFFAAFGAVIVATSLIRSISVNGPHVAMAQAGASGNLYQGMTETLPQTSVSQQAAVRSTATEQEVARACLALQTLNRLQRLAAAAPASLPADESEVAIRDAKLAMLERIWDADAWGDFETFKQWATGGIADTASPAKAIFEAQSPAFPAGSGISASGSHSLSSV